MQTDFNEEYSPDLQEIKEYGEYIGLDLDEDEHLLWLADEGIRAKLPEPWKAFRNQQQELIYVNIDTQEAMVEHPMDQVYMQKVQQIKQMSKGQQQIQQ